MIRGGAKPPEKQQTLRFFLTVVEAKLLVRKIKSGMMSDAERATLQRTRDRLEAAIAGAGDEPPPGGMAA